MATIKQIESVKAYARARYAKGWDVIVECSTDDELADLIDIQGGVRAALSCLREEVKLRREYADDIRATAF